MGGILKHLKWILLLVWVTAHAQTSYNYFYPGGALSGGPTVQSINLSSGVYVQGVLPVTNGGIGAMSFAAAGVATITGVSVSGHCAQWASAYVITDSGAPCGGGGGGSSAFSALTSSANSTAAMVCTTGCSLTATGSGIIVATNVPVAGNPTGTIGLTAANGTATTWMRSDASQALSQSISPTMTGQWTFTTNTGNLLISPVATWAEDWHMADSRTGGKTFSAISGFCGGSNPGTWGLYDYTDSQTLLCVTPSGSGGGLFMAGATGGNKGAGTINATALYANGVLIGSANAANPTGTIGLTAVNGTQSTYMRSDAAPPLSQSISPTMSGNWTFTSFNGLNLTPSSSIYAEDWHLNDQQIGGHSYGAISGYCGGIQAGSWTLYDYTASVSRICVGPNGNVTIAGASSGATLVAQGQFTATGNGAVSVANGTDAYMDVTTASTRNVLMEENDTGSTSGTGMPAHSSGLLTTTGNLFLHASGGSVVSDSQVQSQGLADFPSNTPGLTAHAGSVGSPIFTIFLGLNLSWNGSNWVSGTDGGSNGGGLVTANQQGVFCIRTIASTGGTNQVISNGSLPNCALEIDSSQNITAPGAASVPWPAQSTGSGTLASTAGCSGAVINGGYTYQVVGKIATITISSSGLLCNPPGVSGVIDWGTLASAVIPASSHMLSVVMQDGFSSASGQVPAQCTVTSGGAIACITNVNFSGPASGLAANTTLVYPLN